jgi:hypothetical protein
LKPAAGLIISNGFKRFTVDDWVFETGAYEQYVRDDIAGLKDYFQMNGRVKVLEVLNDSGETVAVLDLRDQRDSQTFFGRKFLPGVYRFVIKEVYPGSKWNDTCLAEITFIPYETSSLMSYLFTDPFFGKVINILNYFQ